MKHPHPFPHLGHGIGLRNEHYQQVVSEHPNVDWFEVISENFMVPGGNPRRVLRAVREHYPVVLHGVSLSIGSTDPLDERYLTELAALAAEVQPAWISDHLCWGSIDGMVAHDLLPLPHTEEALAHVVARVAQVQDRLGRRMLLENVSSYLTFAHSVIPEWQFLAEVARRADCGILLDINNVFVSAHNHGFDPLDYLAGIPAERVGQLHLAGHSTRGELLIDTHDQPVPEAVWELYRTAVAMLGPRSTLIEWDAQIPALERLQAESARARALEAEVQGQVHGQVQAEAQAEVLRRQPGANMPDAPSLRALERQLFALIRAPDGVEQALADRRIPGLTRRSLQRLLPGDGRLDGLGRLGIYAEMYFLRLQEVLRESFPKLATVTAPVTSADESAFNALCTDYLDANPSRHPSLRHLGDRLPAFLGRPAAERPRCPELPDWAADLAELEWQRYDVFDEADAELLSMARLQALPPQCFPSLPIHLIPAHRRVTVEHAVEDVWRSINKSGHTTATFEEPERRSGQLLIWRQDNFVYHRRVAASELAPLAAAAAGTTFAEVCEVIAADLERAAEAGAPAEDPAKASFALLARWATDGLLQA